MIEKISAYKSSDGKFVGAIEEVHKYELKLLFEAAPMGVGVKGSKEDADAVANAVACIVNNRDKVVDILTTGPKSKPSARSINGATRKKRTPRAVVPTVAAAPEETR